MSIPLVPNLLRAHLAELAAEDKRHDGRGRFEGRDVELEINCYLVQKRPLGSQNGRYNRFSWCQVPNYDSLPRPP